MRAETAMLDLMSVPTATMGDMEQQQGSDGLKILESIFQSGIHIVCSNQLLLTY